MDLTRYALEKKVVTSVALVVILLSGISAYRTLPRAEDPGFLIRTALVTTPFPGASPERVELLVTDKLEKAIQEIPEVDNVTSQSRTNLSIVTVNFKENETDLQPLFDKLRRKVERAQRDLPDGVAPTVDDEFGDVFGTVVTLVGDGLDDAELKNIADQVRNELLKLDEVAKVEIHGDQEERVFVEYNNARLSELGLSTSQLQNILVTSNIINPGGSVEAGFETIALEPSGNFGSVEAIRETVVTLPGSGEVVFLGDIAEIYRGYVDPPELRVRATGQSALVLAISMREGGNIIALGDAVTAEVRRLESLLPIGVEFDFVSFQPEIVSQSITAFTGSIGQSVAIVLACMLIFLGLRTGLVVASLIPMAMLLTLMIMSMIEVGLDKVSLAALIIALGLLVDNSIVMSEAILVRLEQGEDAVKAALASARELRVPLLISSLTTAAAFLPIALAESAVGEYTAPLAIVVTITLLSSWLLAISMTPLLCVLFLRVKQAKKVEEEKEFGTPFYRRYRTLLLLFLRRPVISVLGIYGLFVGSLGLFAFVEQSFFPSSEAVMFTGDFELPVGTAFWRTEEIVHEIERFMMDEMRAADDSAELQNWAFFVGNTAPRFNLGYAPGQPKSNYAALLANATTFDALNRAVTRIQEHVERNYPEVEITLKPLASGVAVANPIEIRIYGDDKDILFGLAAEVKQTLGAIEGTRNISDNWGRQTKKLLVRVDETRARRAGVTNQDIAVSLQTALSGLEATEYREGDQTIPVVVRSEASDRQDVGKLESLNVYAQGTGNNVPLKQVADIEVVFEPSIILRRDRSKALSVTSELDSNTDVTAFDIVNAIEPRLAAMQEGWPLGYTYEIGGEFESSSEANQSIADKLPLAGLIILLLLVGQFNSIRKPAIILLTIPLGLIGVVAGLLITGQPFGFMTLLGVISLAGIVINNAIVLIDRVQIEIDENGLQPARAVVEAAQRRLRPILLTTATTVGGLLPLWLGGDPLFESMAVAILFGLVFATVLTLGFVPALYSVLFRVRFREFSYE